MTVRRVTLLALILTCLQLSDRVCGRPQVEDAVNATDTACPAVTTQLPLSTASFFGVLNSGIYYTSLERDGHPSLQPFPTVIVYNPTTSAHRSTQAGVRPSSKSSGNLVPSTSKTSSTSSSATIKTALVASTSQVVETSKVHSSTSTSTTTVSDLKSTSATEVSESLALEPANSTSVSCGLSKSNGSILSQQSTQPTESSSGNCQALDLGTSTAMTSQDVFQPISLNAIPPVIKSRGDHPVPTSGIINANGPIETNKFYAGFFLGSRGSTTFSHPYSLAWAQGAGNAQSWGISISHIEASQLAYGPPNASIPGSPSSYYINPIGIQSMILSATEFDSSVVLNVSNPTAFSAQVVLSLPSAPVRNATFPVVQGMGFVTAIYNNLQPTIQSSIFFRSVVTVGCAQTGVFKYRVTLEDGTNWLVYVTPDDGTNPNLTFVSNTLLRGPAGFHGSVQVTKNPAGTTGEKFFDNSTGAYPVSANITGSVTASSGTYSLTWQTGGKYGASAPLLMYALPHHVQSFDNATQSRVISSIQLRTTTKGLATAVIGNSWTMVETGLPTDMGFAPWSPTGVNVTTLSAASQQLILNAAPTELNQNISAETNLDSMYFSGKALSKFATLVYTVNTLANNPTLAASALQELKNCYARFVNNQQIYPLLYDTTWKGVVSSGSYVTNDSGVDFGNSYYNDHHFHYGYFIHAAAIIGSLDPTWIPANKDWVNMLARDAGNSVSNDPYFPFSRSFDWFHGHSWAKGLFESSDGKDQESTSEDVMFAYAVKMWGHTIGDASMEARGNLMLAILRRSLNNYFLMLNSNVNQPSRFIANKVTGILFENKCDHTTYFGTNLEYIQGIHMIPILPCSAYVRNKQFVAQEWNAMFAANASDPAQNVVGGWKGLLYANLAIIDAAGSLNFFNQANFDYSWIDGGASRTWYLAYAAGMLSPQ